MDSYPITDNDAIATAKLAEVFDAQFGNRSYETQPASASEDFSVFGRNWKVPYVFWFVSGTDPKTYLEAKKSNQLNSIPSNHSPKFAPCNTPNVKNRFTDYDDGRRSLVQLNCLSYRMEKLHSFYYFLDLAGTFALQ